MPYVFLRLQTEKKRDINKLIIRENVEKDVLIWSDIVNTLLSIGFNINELDNFSYSINHNNIGKKLNIPLDNKKLCVIEIKFKIVTREFKKKALTIFFNNSIIIKNEKKRKEEQQRQLIENKKNEILNKPIVEIYTVNSEKMITKNKNFLKQLQNKDLLFLLKVYKTKPELFEQMYQLVSNQTVINNIDFNTIELTDFKDYEETFNNLKIILSNFKLKINENLCKKILIHFEGNCDRTFRYLLTSCSLE